MSAGTVPLPCTTVISVFCHRFVQADATLEMEQRDFARAALEYVCLIQVKPGMLFYFWNRIFSFRTPWKKFNLLVWGSLPSWTRSTDNLNFFKYSRFKSTVQILSSHVTLTVGIGTVQQISGICAFCLRSVPACTFQYGTVRYRYLLPFNKEVTFGLVYRARLRETHRGQIHRGLNPCT